MTVKDSEIWQRIKPFAMRDIGDLIGMVGGSGSAGEEYAIILFDKSELAMSAYSCSDDGMAGALGAAASGDVIWVPPVTLADAYTIPSGVCVIGTEQKTIFNGAITNNGELMFSLIGGTLNNASGGVAISVATATSSAIIYATTSNIGDGHEGSVVLGGEDHDLNAGFGVIGGGLQNLIENTYSFIGGGGYNVVKSAFGVVVGGNKNEISDTGSSYGFMGGGYDNDISGSDYAAIVGGYGNILDTGADDSFIGAGYQNKIQDNDAVIGGGDTNLIKVGGNYAGILAGDGNTIGDGATASNDSAIVAGSANTVIGYNSIIPAGEANLINGANNAFAQGRRAHIGAGHHGAVLFADNTDADVNSAAANEFAVRATGGFRFLPKVGVGAVVVGINTSGQITSDLAIGTAPMTVVSTTVVTNLNADTVDGHHAADFAEPGDLHSAVTLDGDAAVLLDLSGQEIGLDTQDANKVFAGPTAGAANEPTFRALVAADLGSGAPDGTKFLRDDLSWQVPAGGGGAHDLLSATHGDTAADAVTRGSLIYGNATPKWDELVKGTAGAVITCDADDVAWSTFYLAGSSGHTYTFPDETGTVALMAYDNVGNFAAVAPYNATIAAKSTVAGSKYNIALQSNQDDEGAEVTYTYFISTDDLTDDRYLFLPNGSLVFGGGGNFNLQDGTLEFGVGPLNVKFNESASFPFNAHGYLHNDGVGALSWAAQTGDISTDTLWDAKGDLAVGTGANAGAKLTVGDNGTLPVAASGEATGIKWDMPFYPCNGRLTLTSGTPVTTADVTAATAVYFCPYLGDYIALYDGSNWVVRNFTEKHIDLTETQNGTTTNGNKIITGLTDTSQLIVGMLATGTGIGAAPNAIASIDSTTQVTLSVNSTASATVAVTFKAVVSLPHDIFAFDNSGTVKLEMVAWTNTTTRATALATQNGVYVKNGATTRRYLGTICTTATGGQTEDSDAKRLIWNFYNRIIRQTMYTDGTGHTYATATWRYWNNDSTNAKLQYVCGLVDNIRHIDTIWYKSVSANIYGYNGMSEDRVEGDLCTNFCYIDAGHTLIMEYGSSMTNLPLLGYHYISVCEYSSGATTTFSYVRASMSMPM